MDKRLEQGVYKQTSKFGQKVIVRELFLAAAGFFYGCSVPQIPLCRRKVSDRNSLSLRFSGNFRNSSTASMKVLEHA